MNRVALICALLISVISINSVLADVSVRGYFRKDGTYVQPHHRSDPDGNSFNNWSSKGNVNPYTGEEGTKEPGYDKSEQQGPNNWILDPDQ